MGFTQPQGRPSSAPTAFSEEVMQTHILETSLTCRENHTVHCWSLTRWLVTEEDRRKCPLLRGQETMAEEVDREEETVETEAAPISPTPPLSPPIYPVFEIHEPVFINFWFIHKSFHAHCKVCWDQHTWTWQRKGGNKERNRISKQKKWKLFPHSFTQKPYSIPATKKPVPT